MKGMKKTPPYPRNKSPQPNWLVWDRKGDAKKASSCSGQVVEDIGHDFISLLPFLCCSFYFNRPRNFVCKLQLDRMVIAGDNGSYIHTIVGQRRYNQSTAQQT